MSADYQVHGQIAVITLNNPPVNGLGFATRSAIVHGIRCALADEQVKAIVLAGAGKAFSGGADIKEFNSASALAEPTLYTLIGVAENSTKPVIAAIHGICMGGGLELALGCHYRVSAPGAQIALPEVKLGLLPGAGGTQRLPRVLGLELALNMIVSGAPVASDKLAKTALFDAIIPAGAEFLPSAIAFADQVAGQRPLPKVRDRKVDYPHHDAFLQFSRNCMKTVASPVPAPMKCMEAVAAAVKMKFEDGLKFERDLFMQLIQSTESKALRHAFFAERMAGKVPGLPADAAVRPIARAAVVGAALGGEIALAFANAGVPALLVDPDGEALAAALARLRQHYEDAVKSRRLTPQQGEQRLALVSAGADYAGLGGADIVIEAVSDDLAAKEAAFRLLDGAAKPGAILASQSAGVGVERLAEATRRPRDVIGLRFHGPADAVKLLEVVRGARTDDGVLASVLALARTLRKTAVVAGPGDGLIADRMLVPLLRQAGRLLDEGCLPEQVDLAMEKFGFARGPFRLSDALGNDACRRLLQRQPDAAGPRAGRAAAGVPTADALCAIGRLGQQAGAGWYDYAGAERKPYPSLLVNDMVVQRSAELDLRRRPFDEQEIVERLTCALANEGARILQEGVALRASDIDTACLAGHGFPAHRGGPMFYADTVGLPQVLDALERDAAGREGEAWSPAPLLVRLAAEGKSFTR